MYANSYVPGAENIAGAPGGVSPSAVRTADPKMLDPTLWLIALVAVWAGLIRFGVNIGR